MMNKHSKIYVAGHNGMVGSAITEKLSEAGYENLLLRSSKELDLRDQTAVNTFFKEEKPEYVFLAAAKVGGIIANNTYKADFIFDNLQIASNVIKSSYDNGVKKLLNLGSSCIYPKYSNQPIKEEYLLTGELEPTNEPYAIAKIAAIKLCRYFNEQYKTNYISLMPTNLYGRNDNYNLETSHVLPAIMRKMILSKALQNNDLVFLMNDLKKNKLGFGLDERINPMEIESIEKALNEVGVYKTHILLWGTGKVLREFLHTDDLANASVFFMENVDQNQIGEHINIGTGSDVSIRALAGLIKEITGMKGDVLFDNTKPDGTPRKQLDITKAKNLGWLPKINLKSGVQSIYEHYMGNVNE